MSAAIVLARVDLTGVEPTGEWERYDGVNYRPKVRIVAEAKACIWLRDGTRSDEAKAKAFAEKEGWTVLTFPTSEPDPLGLARRKIMDEKLPVK